MGLGFTLGGGLGVHSTRSWGTNSLYFRRELWKSGHQNGKAGHILDGRGVNLKQLHKPRDVTRPNLARTICVR